MHRKKIHVILLVLIIILLTGCSEAELPSLSLSEIIKRQNFDVLVMFNNYKTALIQNETVLDEYYKLIEDTLILEVPEEKVEKTALWSKEDVRIVFNDESGNSKGMIFLIKYKGAFLIKEEEQSKEVFVYLIKSDKKFVQFCEKVLEDVENESIIQ